MTELSVHTLVILEKNNVLGDYQISIIDDVDKNEIMDFQDLFLCYLLR